MKIAILFPGQGAQYVGMGKELYENYTESKMIYDKANSLLGWDLQEVCFQDSSELIHQTRYTQAALFTTNCAIYKALQTKNVKVEATLGFSLGEYSAMVASDIITFEEGLKLVEKRACYMEECTKAHPGGMVAVIGLNIDKINEVCKKVNEYKACVEVSNDNCDGQVTLSGTKEALEEASVLLKEAGARRVVPLQVSGAFHSSLMKVAAKQLEQELEGICFKEPTIPIVSNVTAKTMNKDEVIHNIPLQIVKGVRFRESILNLLEEGFDTFIEVGPKKTLSNFVKKISKNVCVISVEDIKTLDELVLKIEGGAC